VAKIRKIIHLDLDSFYASVEMKERPELRHVPLAIAYDGPRSVLCTSNYLAREFGVRSAQPLGLARKLCPHLVVVHPRFDLYRQYSERVMDIVCSHSEHYEILGADEVYLDVTEVPAPFIYASSLAKHIQKKVFKETGLTCSIGLSPLRFVSKIASDLNKPFGLTVITPEILNDFLYELPIAKISGLGEKSVHSLAHKKIFTLGNVLPFSFREMKVYWGKMGQTLYWYARGIDEREMTRYSPPVSVSSEETLREDVYCHEVKFFLQQEVIQGFLQELEHHFFKRVLRQQENFRKHFPHQVLSLKSLGVKIKNTDFQVFQIQKLLPESVTEKDFLKDSLWRHSFIQSLWFEVLSKNPCMSWRLFGLTGTWRQQDMQQLALFDDCFYDKSCSIN